MYTQSTEFWKELSEIERGKINYEISYMAMCLKILSQLFNTKSSKDVSIIAWPKNEENTAFVFSCAVVAGKVLGVSPSSIRNVCRGKAKTAKGYIFMYENEYNSTRI